MGFAYAQGMIAHLKSKGYKIGCYYIRYKSYGIYFSLNATVNSIIASNSNYSNHTAVMQMKIYYKAKCKSPVGPYFKTIIGRGYTGDWQSYQGSTALNQIGFATYCSVNEYQLSELKNCLVRNYSASLCY